MMRYLGLDVGERRIGVAVSDPLGITAQPAGVIERSNIKETVSRIREMVDRCKIGTLVIGIPINMNGSEGESARTVRRFSERIRSSIPVSVVMWDERLTTLEAGRAMKGTGLSRRKRSKHLDTVSAQIILQSYLDSRTSQEKQTPEDAEKAS